MNIPFLRYQRYEAHLTAEGKRIVNVEVLKETSDWLDSEIKRAEVENNTLDPAAWIAFQEIRNRLQILGTDIDFSKIPSMDEQTERTRENIDRHNIGVAKAAMPQIKEFLNRIGDIGVLKDEMRKPLNTDGLGA